MNIKQLLVPAVCSLLLLPLQSCDDDADKQAQAEYMKEQIDAFESTVDQLNASILCYQSLLSGEIPVGITPIETGYKVELSGGNAYNIGTGEKVDAFFPLITISQNGNWAYSFDGSNYLDFTDPSGKTLNAYSLEDIEAAYRSPQLQIDNEGFWKMTCDGGTTYTYLSDTSRSRIAAFGGKGSGMSSLFSDIVYNETAGKLSLALGVDKGLKDFPVINNFYLKVKGSEAEDGLTFFLNEERKFLVETSDVMRTKIKAPDGWTVTLKDEVLSIKAPASVTTKKTQPINFIITSSKHYQRTITLEVELLDNTDMLPNFSFAGYMHGEVAPPEMEELIARGYKVINVCDFGATPNDNKSDRQAFINAIASIKGVKKHDESMDNNTGVNGGKSSYTLRLHSNNPVNTIIYFPEGEYILQDASEVNHTIALTMENIVIKGAGRDKTVIRMDERNEKTDNQKEWSAPTMLQIKHYSGLSDLADVTGNAAKGSFEIAVSNTTNIHVGDWVCLYVLNNDPDFVAEEIAPHPLSDLDDKANIKLEGANVIDYHQVTAVSNGKLTFAEPIMRKVEAKYNWKIKKYPHYENIGVEDLTFQGKAVERFEHHEETPDGGSFDGDYKLIDFSRLTNSWMRRVNFVSVSEATSIISCANFSAYDIEISGNRGHSAVRSNSSSRVFIGKVYDHSSGYRIPKAGELAEWMENAGQYHGCGVSKPSMGAVIWNVQWGDDACYEAHASQPRATLIDRCTGAFIPSRQGGDRYEVPNHLGDLIIWNMNATRTGYESNWNNQFVWWDKSSAWSKTVPPVIVGFHGASINFAETFISDVPQNKRIESQGSRVEPYSLYEAQLRRRLGYVPAWLTALK